MLSLLAYCFCCFNWRWDLLQMHTYIPLVLAISNSREIKIEQSGNRTSTKGQVWLGHKSRMGMACITVFLVPPKLQRQLPPAFLFLGKGENSWQLGWKETGTDTAYASSFHFFLYECSHDTLSRSISPESPDFSNNTSSPLGLDSLLGRKRTHCE